MYLSARRLPTAAALLLVCACTRDTVNPRLNRPMDSFLDGSHGGNPDFFFLPPIFPNPVNSPNYSANAFNPNVRPTVEICELVAGVCGNVIQTFASSDITLSTTGQLYQVNWDTGLSNLNVLNIYRIRVLLGTHELGFADVDPVATGGELKNIDTGEYIGLIDGRTLPIKFRIENGAACNGAQCNSGTIDLSQGGSVVFAATGDRVDIPAQQSNRVVTVTVQACPNLDVDIPVFGNCLRVTADPPLGTTKLSPPATVSMCSLTSFVLPPLHAQQDLITLHRKDDAVILALPHSTDFCSAGGTIGRAADDASRSLAARGWRALRHAVAWAVTPASLHASSLVFDVGAGGQTDGFSDFQFALPAQMSVASLAGQTVFPNSPVPSVPAVMVTDALGNPVANATVHFTTSGGGTIVPPSPVVTGTDGLAALTSWQVGGIGSYGVQASGRGIADPRNGGVYAPPIFHDPQQDEGQTPVLLGSGSLGFAALSAAPDLVVSTGTPTVTPATVAAGSTITLSNWTILNQGNADAASGVRNGFYLSTDAAITTADVLLDVNNNTASVLTAGNGFNWGSPTLTIPANTSPGTYYIGILVDDLNQVAEANEGNNYASVAVVVTAPIVIGSAVSR